MSSYRNLLLGCGRSRRKQFCARPDHPTDWLGELVTLDIRSSVDPDLICDLDSPIPWYVAPRVIKSRAVITDSFKHEGQSVFSPTRIFVDDYWDEIHAYQVLEHLGQQGNWRAFCAHFEELWRILKPGGYLVASVPSRLDESLWGDPSHTRVICPMSLVFLDQSEYARQIDQLGLSMSDFRHVYRGDFRHVESVDNRKEFVFVLQAVKPSRWKDLNET